MSFIRHSAHSDRDPHDERRSAVYLPNALATKLLCVCDAAAGLGLSEPNSPIDSDLEDLWSNIRASSVIPVDSCRAEEDIRRFAERYGLEYCLSCSNLSWLGEDGKLKTPSENVYEELLEAAFGNTSGRTAFENGGPNNSSQIEDLIFNFDETGGPAESSTGITHSSSYLSETPRIYHDRPHTPQILYVRLSQQRYQKTWEVPDLTKKPSFFPPTLRNIKKWLFWRKLNGRS